MKNKPLTFAIICNLFYHLLMGTTILPSIAGLCVFTLIQFLGDFWGSLIAMLTIEWAVIALFALLVPTAKCNPKAWVYSLPLQYVLGVAVEYLTALAVFGLFFSWEDFKQSAMHTAYIFRPLVLLAIQTLIIYLRHRRVRGGAGVPGKGEGHTPTCPNLTVCLPTALLRLCFTKEET